MISTLVGGYWYEHTRAGLWCSTSGNSSDVSRARVGARPLILKYRDLVCMFRCLRLSTLVGGIWLDNTRCGLWYWYYSHASSLADGGVGARLLM